VGTYPGRLRRWTRAEYERLIDAGVFQPGEPLELLGGELMVGEPQGSAHYTAIGLVEDALRAALGPGWLVRSQGPIALTHDSEPEPDVAVTRPKCRNVRPDPGLGILNLVDQVLEVYRGPTPLVAPDARIPVSDLLP
jgi:Uma2 family endonuclease